MKNRHVMLSCMATAVAGCSLFALYVSYGKRHSESVNCGNYMASIGCGAKAWALDNSGLLASDFCSMSNELSTPRILVCPGDHQRVPARDWASLNESNCSYEIVAPGLSLDDTTNIYFRCKLHGHLGYADGTVFDGKQRRTKVLW